MCRLKSCCVKRRRRIRLEALCILVLACGLAALLHRCCAGAEAISNAERSGPWGGLVSGAVARVCLGTRCDSDAAGGLQRGARGGVCLVDAGDERRAL